MGWLSQQPKDVATSHPTAQPHFAPRALQGILSTGAQKTLGFDTHGETVVFPYSV